MDLKIAALGFRALLSGLREAGGLEGFRALRVVYYVGLGFGA